MKKIHEINRTLAAAKKSIFIFAALFAATFANAQITLEHTFDGVVEIACRSNPFESDSNPMVQSACYYSHSSDNHTLKLYDIDTYNLLKTYTYTLPSVSYPMVDITLITKGYFTTDGKIAFIMTFQNEVTSDKSSNFCRIIDEDGNIVYDFNNAAVEYISLIKVGDDYKLVLTEGKYFTKTPKTYVYSLPGNGDISTDIPAPSSPKRSARKMARDGQVVVETENSIYTLTGTEIK
ncbi:MAG: hypothetical protein J6Y00_03700 [Paludibacteraceae bacterium]|nr:hypothetical protein [Paludibacteraceae bacterium]